MQKFCKLHRWTKYTLYQTELMSTDNCLFENDNFYDTFYSSSEKTDCWKCLNFQQPPTHFIFNFPSTQKKNQKSLKNNFARWGIELSKWRRLGWNTKHYSCPKQFIKSSFPSQKHLLRSFNPSKNSMKKMKSFFL